MVENCCENLVLGEDTRGWGGMRSLGYSVVVAILQLAGSKYTHSRGFSQDNPTRYSLVCVERHCNKIYFRGRIKNTCKSEAKPFVAGMAIRELSISSVPGQYRVFGEFVTGMATRGLAARVRLAMLFTNVRE